ENLLINQQLARTIKCHSSEVGPGSVFSLFYVGRRKPAGRNPAGCHENAVQSRSIGRILYAGFPRRAIIPLGEPLLDRSSHLPACLDGAALPGLTAVRMPIWCCSG